MEREGADEASGILQPYWFAPTESAGWWGRPDCAPQASGSYFFASVLALLAAGSFADASKQAGIERIIYLGGLGETGQNLSEHLRSRREVEKVLGSTGIPVTVLRAAMIIGSGSA